MRNQLVNVEDYRLRAKKRIPRVAFDYVDGAAESELTMRENRRAFEEVALRPHQGVLVGKPDLTTSVLGMELSMPLMVGPCGMARIVNNGGDVAAARAAGNAGTAFSLATRSGNSIEEVAAATSGPKIFQVYNVGGKEKVAEALERAAKAGYNACFLTYDTQVHGIRERDVRNGAEVLLGPNKLKTLPYLPQLFRHPWWFAKRIADGLVPTTPNVPADDDSDATLSSARRPASLAWEDIKWVREAWEGPIVIKGILSGEDARIALDSGADAVIVSNHGGRQLDCTEATLRVLPEVVAAVGDRCDVLLDGGIRRGSDVIKAVALGAKAVLIGRPWMYGLGAGGQAGVEGVLKLFRTDIERSMQLMGCASIADLNSSVVRAPAAWFQG